MKMGLFEENVSVVKIKAGSNQRPWLVPSWVRTSKYRIHFDNLPFPSQALRVDAICSENNTQREQTID